MSTSSANLQRLTAFKAATGMIVSLRVWENVLDWQVTDTTATLKVEVWRYADTDREVRFTARGERLFGWVLTPNGWASIGQPMTLWDDEFKPFIHVKYGRSVSPREHAEQRAWERQCYRPGTDRFPLDNYARVLDGPTTPAMERYW